MSKDSDRMRKFQQGVNQHTWRVLVREAKIKDISVQELLRADVIPLWMRLKSIEEIEREKFLRLQFIESQKKIKKENES